MKVLVTGGGGFIGTHTVWALEKAGHIPVVYDRHRHRIDEPIASELFTETILGDVRDATAVTEAAAHVDAIVHLAAVLGTQETINNPLPAAETNILGTINVFQAAAAYQLPVAYICVGNHWMNNGYSISKTAGERYAHMFNQYRDADIRIVRALNAYGPGQSVIAPWGSSKVRKITPTFIHRALDGLPIEVYGDGTQVMDMIHVRDVARVMAAAATHPDIPTETVYEAGSGNPTTVNDIAQLVVDLVGGGEIVHLPMRPGETPGDVVLGDPATLQPLGITPDTFLSLEVGLKETIEHYAAVL